MKPDDLDKWYALENKLFKAALVARILLIVIGWSLLVSGVKTIIKESKRVEEQQ